MSIGLNVLAFPQPDVTQLIDWLTEARPKYTLVMDGLDIAARAAMTGTQVLFRRYRTDDHKLYETINPAQFLDSIADVPASYLVQCLNEPNGNQARMVDWLVALIALADQRGRRLALPNWSVGNPDTEAVANGVYDPLWRAMAASGRHVLGVHEYARESPLREPFHVGRYKSIVARFDALKLKRPTVIVTEHGRDLAGGNDGWRTVFSEAEYAAFLAEAQTVYEPDDVCALVFCYGAGFGWQSFNVEGATDLLRAMAAMNSAEEGDEVAAWGLKKVQTKEPGAEVNFRSEPKLTAPVLHTVKTGDYLRPYGTPVNANGHSWQRVNDENCKTGWVSLNVLELV